MIMDKVIEYAKEAIVKYPHLLEQIEGCVQLCKDEIEAGESSEHEMELCIEDIRQLTEGGNEDEL